MAKKKKGEAAEPETHDTLEQNQEPKSPPPQTPEDLDNHHAWAKKHFGEPEE